MTGVDLHPEDLLEREAGGDLLPAEREHLERHLRQCNVCRFERLARVDFQRDSERLNDDLDVRRLLANALAGGPVVTPRIVRRRYRRLPRQMLIAAGIAMIAGTAGAAVIRFSGEGAFTLALSNIDRREPLAPPPEGVRLVLSPAPVLAVDSGMNAPAPEADLAQATRASVSSPLPSSPVASEGIAWKRSAAAVFARANDSRRSGDRAHAEFLYRLLVERHSSTPEAHHAQALLGQMLLDSGDSGNALRFLDDYLSKDGALREDVMLERAIALQRLGRMDEEAAAWTTLLQAYPESVHAEGARGRLSELGKR